MGRDESIARKGGYPFRGQREQGEWNDEIQEREEGENGQGKLKCSVCGSILSRLTSRVQFETKEWSLETMDGRKLQLLDQGREDPFKNTSLEAEAAA